MIKQYRIRKNEEFSKIVAKKQSIASGNFVLYYNDSKEEYSRIGISVSKKLGKAVVRNKIKRQVRMMVNEVYDYRNNKLDLIIIVRNKYLNNTYKDNRLDLEKLIKKAIIKRYGQGDF